MKINRFVALAIIALLVVGAMGLIASRSLAKVGQDLIAQMQDCSQEQTDGTEVQSSTDTDKIDRQCDDQNNADEQVDDQDASVSGTEVPDATESQGDQAATATPAISADQAQAAALAAHPGTVLKTELDDEGGKLVYSVQFEGGVEVKVDAMTGTVIATETGED